jgi:hypothetical protein
MCWTFHTSNMSYHQLKNDNSGKAINPKSSDNLQSRFETLVEFKHQFNSLKYIESPNIKTLLKTPISLPKWTMLFM